MTIRPSRRLAALGSYVFAEVDRKVQELEAKGIAPIDFGVGDPTMPTPSIVRQATQKAVDDRAQAGYPSYVGDPAFRQAVATWVQSRYGLALDPATEVSTTIGSKEAVFNFHEALVDPGDVVICPTPGYPPYARGAQFAEGTAYPVALEPDRGFLIDFADIPQDVARRAKLMWLNYPNSPSGAVATEQFYRHAVEFARNYDIVLASDEAYSEIYFGDTPPLSLLNVTREGVIVFNSLSKRSAMTCYRIGWVMGDPEVVALFRKVKTNVDSGTATFIQDGAVAALGDEQHVKAFREEYRSKRDLLCTALATAGLPDCTPEATLYVWQRVPAGLSSVAFAERLLEPDIAVVTTPGTWIAEPTADGHNPGEGFVRFALVPSIGDTTLAATRISRLSF